MYRALIGLITRWPARMRIAKTTKMYRPEEVDLPTARTRISLPECSASLAKWGSFSNISSISPIETPWPVHFARLPSSQSNPATLCMPEMYVCTYKCQCDGGES
jgi:hypothetical protein